MPAQSVESASDSACATSFSFWAPDRVPLGLERGEVGLAPLGERVPRGRQPLPQHRLDGPVGVRGGLPLLEQLGHPLAALLPVRGLGRDPLGLVDDPLLDPAGLVLRLLAGGLDLLPALVDDAGQRLEPGLEPVEVADRVRVGHGGQQPLHGCLGLGGGDLGRLHALLEQRDLGLEGRELAPEEHECLFRAPRRPRADHPLAIGGTHVDRPVGVYPTPGIVGGGHGEPPGSPAAPACAGAKCSSALLLVGHVFLMLTLSMMTLSFGTPPPAPRKCTKCQLWLHSGGYPARR